ncbi:MAG: lipocalin-like domain-containing protein [Deltaproteobacteria bacterium]
MPGAFALFIGMTAIPGVTFSGSPASQACENIRNRFLGPWRLVWLEEAGPDGKIHKADCTGLLVYTRDGHMSVQVMYRNPQAGAHAGPVQYSQGGYEVSYGTYRIEDARTFTYRVDGALVRTLVGKDFTRAYEFSGRQLVVRSPNPNEHWRVAWEHY